MRNQGLASRRVAETNAEELTALPAVTPLVVPECSCKETAG
jgi:hypothetical protein